MLETNILSLSLEALDREIAQYKNRFNTNPYIIMSALTYQVFILYEKATKNNVNLHENEYNGCPIIFDDKLNIGIVKVR